MWHRVHVWFRRLARWRAVLAVGVALAACAASGPAAHGQRIAKYGADFLAGGVGARALGMGGAYVGLAGDVTAGYWNPAGLHQLQYPEIAYMHVERFAGAVSFDYGAGALPISERSTVSLSFFRSGVNDIVNTLEAWDPSLGQPKPNYESYITRFSAADYAFFLGYARRLSGDLTLGLTGKIIRRTIGDFADAWGYSFDASLQYRAGPVRLGATVQDLSTMLQSWSVNRSAFQATDGDGNSIPFEEAFGQAIPVGGTALVLPVARLGSGIVLPIGTAHRVTLGLDVDLAFDGQQAFVPNVGDVSFHPRIGGEYSYKDVVALRAGVNRMQVGDDIGLDVTPSVGAGLTLDQFSIDVSFGDFTGLTAEDLGYSYRISAQLRLEQPGLKRGGEN
ncbi:MAG: PorV/PorQ family protein [Bacteroidetes bacterium]|jgi:hypothetical protein|nr:PorV/PorQ family protein [Bacteroidota bacterium]